MAAVPPDPYMRRSEAAAFLGLAASTLEKWACIGGGPPFCRFGRSVRYRRSDLEAWAGARTAGNAAEARAKVRAEAERGRHAAE